MMDMIMQMTIYWRVTCTIVFESFKTDDQLYFTLAVFSCILWGYVTKYLYDYLAISQSEMMQSAKSVKIIDRIVLSLQFFICYFMCGLSMLLMMTYNGWIILALALGQTLCYFFSTTDNLKNSKKIFCH